MTLHETLKQATQRNHDELEKLMYVHQIMDGSLSVKQYQQIISTNYVVHHSFESILFKNLSGSVAAEINIKSRSKFNALEKDRQEINLDLQTNKNTHELTGFFDNDAKILGALYVLEGATLGGSVIVKKLKTNPVFASLNLNFNYYQVYGQELISKWKQFVHVLNEQPQANYPESVTGAIKLFNYIAEVQKQILVFN